MRPQQKLKSTGQARISVPRKTTLLTHTTLWRCLLLSLFLLNTPARSLAQKNHKWRLKNRFQTSYEFDNNIREAATNSGQRIEDTSFRFLFESTAKHVTAKSRLNFSYKGGLQTYLTHAVENKLINEIHGNFTQKLSRFSVGLRGSARLKLYLNHDLDTSTGSIEGFFRLPTLRSFGNEFAVQRSSLAYQNFSNFNYSEWRLQWTVTKNLASRLSLRTSFAARLLDYARAGIQLNPDESILTFADKQKDKSVQFQGQLNYTKKFMLNIDYLFQRNLSNSAGYTFSKHQLTLFFGLPLPKSIWLRSYAAAQIKTYTEKSLTLPIDADPERNESNFIIVDLSKDISANLSGYLRFAYYDNESVIRDIFYRKSLLTLGFDFRF